MMTAILSTLWNSNNSVPITTEQAIEAIQTSRRRHVIVICDDTQQSMSVGELAEAIAAIEQDTDIDSINEQARKRVYISLVQHHLEKLDAAGAIAYQEQTRQVRPTGVTSGLADLVRHIESVCDPTSRTGD